MFDFYKMHKTRYVIIAKRDEECRMIVKSNKKYCKEKGSVVESIVKKCIDYMADKKERRRKTNENTVHRK